MHVILGQPWQRTYNSVPNWRREGINFEYNHARLFTPFLSEDDFTLDSEFDKDNEEVDETGREKKTVNSTKTREQTSQYKDQQKENIQDLASIQPAPKEMQSNWHHTHQYTTRWISKKLVQAIRKNLDPLWAM